MAKSVTIMVLILALIFPLAYITHKLRPVDEKARFISDLHDQVIFLL